MALSKKSRTSSIGIALILLINITGCVELSTFTSTDEYVPAGEVVEQADILEYQTAEVYEDSFTIDFQAEASVKYTLSQKLYWDNAQDVYGELLVKEGDFVKKGDVLATFESSQEDEITVLERELAVKQAKVSLDQVIQTYENLLAAKKQSLSVLTGEEYELVCLQLEELEYEYAYRLLEGEYRIDKQQESLDEILEAQSTKELVAPFDGKIVSVSTSFKTGRNVEKSMAIVQISDIDSRVVALNNGSLNKDVSYLSKVTLTDIATQEEYNGTIVSCPEVTGQSNSPVIIQLEEELPEEKEDIEFRVNGYVLHKEKVLLVDSKAIKKEMTPAGEQMYVYVLNENNAKYKIYVEVGANYNNVAWIADGLEAGQKVIIE